MQEESRRPECPSFRLIWFSTKLIEALSFVSVGVDSLWNRKTGIFELLFLLLFLFQCTYVTRVKTSCFLKCSSLTLCTIPGIIFMGKKCCTLEIFYMQIIIFSTIKTAVRSLPFWYKQALHIILPNYIGAIAR